MFFTLKASITKSIKNIKQNALKDVKSKIQSLYKNTLQLRYYFFSKHRLLRKALSLFLIITLLTNSNAIAFPTAINSVKKNEQSIGLWLAFNYPFVEKWVTGFFTTDNSKKKNDSIQNIEIFPKKTTIQKGGVINFAAIAYGSEDKVISGVKYRWSIQPKDGFKSSAVLNGSTMYATNVGEYEVIAFADGVESRMDISVIEPKLETNALIKELARTGAKISTRESEDTSRSIRNSFAEFGANGEEKKGWNDKNYGAADAPGNQPGNPLAGTEDEGAGSGNFRFSAPVLSLQGRGLSLSLSLFYNSRVWNKSGNEMTFDIDGSSVAPGWSLGFGKMKVMGNSSGCMLIEADGSRHAYTGRYLGTPDGGQRFLANTIDGSFIDYQCLYSGTGFALLPDGTRIDYTGIPSGTFGLVNDLYPTLVTDSNGNQITITYRTNDEIGAIETITDTMGRVVTFHYDSDDRLIEVKGPSMCDSTNNCSQPYRSLVKLHYKQQPLGYSFESGMTVSVPNPNFYLIDAIYYPSNGSGFWFGDSDSYSTYGMITKITEQRGMSWATSSEEQGTVTSGTDTEQRDYNYPLNTNNQTGRTNGANLSDAPTYTKLTESWDKMNSAVSAAVTEYDIDLESTPRTVAITYPNGTKKVQSSYNNSGNWNDGLAFKDEIFDSNGKLLTKTDVVWELDDTNPLNYDSTRTQSIKTTTSKMDSQGNPQGEISKRVEFSYGAKFNQATSTREYDFDGSLLKDTRVEYVNDDIYTKHNADHPNLPYYSMCVISGGPGTICSESLEWLPITSGHRFNLIKSLEVWDGSNNRVTKTDYEYDTEPLELIPGAVQYNQQFNSATTETDEIGACTVFNTVHIPGVGTFTTCGGRTTIPVYDANSVYRGNLTKITMYADAEQSTPLEETVETRKYNQAGNLILGKKSCCGENSTVYNQAMQYAYPVSKSKGAPINDPNSNERVTNNTVYDFNTGVVRQKTNYNGRVSTFEYDPATLRVSRSNNSTGAYVTFGYDDAGMSVTTKNYTSTNQLASHKINYFDGIDKDLSERVLNSDGTWSVTDTKYNNRAEVIEKSKPYILNVETPEWTTTEYDALGRVETMTEPDGSFIESYYNESSRPSSASNLDGETVRSVDAWQRERWGRYNSSGKLVEVVEPNPSSNGSVSATGNLVSEYKYNAIDKVTEVKQGTQNRYFAYDSLGRLIRQKQAEQTATIDDAGNYVGVGGTGAVWAELFKYDDQSNLVEKVDSRGVITKYSYLVNGVEDPLNRLQSTEYILPSNPEPGLIIHEAPKVLNEYMTTGDKRRIKKVTSVDVSNGQNQNISIQEYVYDVEGRTAEQTLTLADKPNYPLVTTNNYDSLNRITEVIYPEQYGSTTPPRKKVQYEYGVGDQISKLKYDNQDQASNFVYNAANQNVSLKTGTGVNQLTEEYTFDSQTGLITNQKLKQTNGNEILDLSYEYRRKENGSYTSGRTGHITEIVNNLDRNRDRAYKYDALGRLIKVVGGLNQTWSQNYSYDRYGNRTGVDSLGVESLQTQNAQANKKNEEENSPNKPFTAKSLSKTDEPISDKLPFDKSKYPKEQDTSSNYSDNESEVTVLSEDDKINKEENLNNQEIVKPDKKENIQTSTKASLTTTQPQFDFDNDGKADYSIYQRSTNTWVINQSSNSQNIYNQYGITGDQIAPGDYDGDGKTDIAVWRPSTSVWFIISSSTGVSNSTQFGLAGDSIIPSDYDGDGKTDIAVWRPSTGYWYILQSSNGQVIQTQFGGQSFGDIPVSADYDGDGKTDIAVWRPSTGIWYIIQSSNGQNISSSFGLSGDVPVQADYDNDAIADIAVWRPSTGYWYILQSSNGQVIQTQFGGQSFGDIPVSADYDGDGKTDIAVWRSSTGIWYIIKSSNSSVASYHFGANGDVAVPSAYRRRSSAPKNQNQEIPRDGLESVSYDTSSNRITNAGFTYDSAGNQTQALTPGGQDSQKFEYDAANRLVLVKSDTNQVLQSYVYGANNQRLFTANGTQSSLQRTYYSWIGSAVIAEFSEGASGTNSISWSKSSVFLGSRLLSTITANGGGSGTLEYHHPDNVGTRITSNPLTGDYFEQSNLPFGTALPSESSNTGSSSFTSYDRSAITQLDYAVNRTYDPQQGRFTQIDPLGSKATTLDNPQTLNLYTYCANDPVNHTDPEGLFFGFLKKLFKWIAKIVAAVVRVVIRLVSAYSRSILTGVLHTLRLIGQIPIIGPIIEFIGTVAFLALLLYQGQFKSFFKTLGLLLLQQIIDGFVGIIIESVKSSIRENPGFFGFFKGLWQGIIKGMRLVAFAITLVFKEYVPVFYGYFCAPGWGIDGPTAGETPIDEIDEACRLHDEELAMIRKMYANDPEGEARAAINADLRLIRRVLFAVRVRGYGGGNIRLFIIFAFSVRIIFTARRLL